MYQHKPMTEETKKKISLANKGRKFTEEHRQNIGKARNGKGHPHSETSKQKIGNANRGRRRPDLSARQWGKNNSQWKGGISSIQNIIRHSLEYKLWRKAVYERDNYTCIWCGNNQGGNLHADHIKPFALFPELRFVLDNGRTLCESCHKKTDTYGRRPIYFKQTIPRCSTTTE